jgi:hypothetical protein
MADYREISQGYAKSAINASMIVNAGAALALLSQLGTIAEYRLLSAVKPAMDMWSFGILLAGLAWIAAFLSARYVDKSEREPDMSDAHLKNSNIMMGAGLLLVVASMGLFIGGCAWLSGAFQAHLDLPYMPNSIG